MVSIFTRIMVALAVVVLLYALWVKTFENRMIYFPYKYPNGFWQLEGAGINVEDCYFQTQDKVKLHGWFVSAKDAKWTVLCCHGNGGNITFCIDQLRFFQTYLNMNALVFDYRGYGRSEGYPSEEGLYKDADATYDYLVNTKKIPPERLILYGHSLGGAVAIDLASRKQCAGLIVESAFTSAREIAREILLFRPASWIIRSKFDSIEKIKKVQVPVLIMHGTRDETIPIRFGKRLFDAAKEPKFFYEIDGAGHNDTYVLGGRAYLEKIRGFISTL